MSDIVSTIFFHSKYSPSSINLLRMMEESGLVFGNIKFLDVGKKVVRDRLNELNTGIKSVPCMVILHVSGEVEKYEGAELYKWVDHFIMMNKPPSRIDPPPELWEEKPIKKSRANTARSSAGPTRANRPDKQGIGKQGIGKQGIAKQGRPAMTKLSKPSKPAMTRPAMSRQARRTTAVKFVDEMDEGEDELDEEQEEREDLEEQEEREERDELNENEYGNNEEDAFTPITPINPMKIRKDEGNYEDILMDMSDSVQKAPIIEKPRQSDIKTRADALAKERELISQIKPAGDMPNNRP